MGTAVVELTGGLLNLKADHGRNVAHWPTASDIAAQANVGVQGISGRAGAGPNPTLLTHQRHHRRLSRSVFGASIVGAVIPLPVAAIIPFIIMLVRGGRWRSQMRIASNCQDRALLLLQIARENPQFEEQATYLAHEWLAVATMQISLGLAKPPEKEVRAN